MDFLNISGSISASVNIASSQLLAEVIDSEGFLCHILIMRNHHNVNQRQKHSRFSYLIQLLLESFHFSDNSNIIFRFSEIEKEKEKEKERGRAGRL